MLNMIMGILIGIGVALIFLIILDLDSNQPPTDLGTAIGIEK